MARRDDSLKRDAAGRRVAPGDTVIFYVDPSKPDKSASEARVVRWTSPGVAEVEYRGTAYDGIDGVHRFDVPTSEFLLAAEGRHSRRARSEHLHRTGNPGRRTR